MNSNRALVFDATEWQKTGDVGDNSQFWKPATVVRRYRNFPHHREELADVIFDHRPTKISHAHFTHSFREYAIPGAIRSHQESGVCRCE